MRGSSNQQTTASVATRSGSVAEQTSDHQEIAAGLKEASIKDFILEGLEGDQISRQKLSRILLEDTLNWELDAFPEDSGYRPLGAPWAEQRYKPSADKVKQLLTATEQEAGSIVPETDDEQRISELIALKIKAGRAILVEDYDGLNDAAALSTGLPGDTRVSRAYEAWQYATRLTATLQDAELRDRTKSVNAGQGPATHCAMIEKAIGKELPEDALFIVARDQEITYLPSRRHLWAEPDEDNAWIKHFHEQKGILPGETKTREEFLIDAVETNGGFADSDTACVVITLEVADELEAGEVSTRVLHQLAALSQSELGHYSDENTTRTTWIGTSQALANTAFRDNDPDALLPRAHAFEAVATEELLDVVAEEYGSSRSLAEFADLSLAQRRQWLVERYTPEPQMQEHSNKFSIDGGRNSLLAAKLGELKRTFDRAHPDSKALSRTDEAELREDCRKAFRDLIAAKREEEEIV